MKVVLEQTTSGINGSMGKAAKLSGTVKADATGEPLEEALAMVYRNNNGTWEQFVGAITQPDGTYTVGGLRTGSYKVEFIDFNGVYAGQFYKDKPTLKGATPVGVTAGATRKGVDARLDLCGSISGTAMDSATLEPLGGIDVVAYVKVGTRWEGWNWTQTAADGTYSFPGMQPGTYKVEFSDFTMGAYAGEFYKDQLTLAKANDVIVVAGQDTGGIDGTLDFGGKITGTVTSAADESPVAGTWVNAYKLVGSAWQWFGGAEANGDGFYSIGGLRTGSYKVEFFDPSGQNAWEFYDGQGTLAKATPISVTLGQATENINATLDPGGSIAGKVTATATKAPLVGMWAVAYRSSGPNTWEPFWLAETNPDGTYNITGLRSGTYKVEFSDPYMLYATEYWNNKTTLAKANTVTVTAPSSTGGINAALDLAPATSTTMSTGRPASTFRPSMRARVIRQ